MNQSTEFQKWLANPPPGEEIVITGASGRFPESENIQDFQKNLFNAHNLVTDDDANWKDDTSEVPRKSGKISNADKLDAGFYGIHHRQAEMLNPITRKFLETAVEAIMDAGVNPHELAGSRTMICIGISYLDMEIATLLNISDPQKFAITGYLKTFIANRLSYHLKLKGPSYVIDTGCSSSMNALHEAFISLRTGKCDNAIVGGGHVIFNRAVTTGFYRTGVLSADGACKVFDKDADGYVRSEAVACIFLQKAKNSRRIYAQVMYSKSNCDGFKYSGITYPSSEMQTRLLTESLQESGIDPSDIDYLDAHGTGTKVGDLQEIQAIDNAIAKKRTKPLLIGALKSNIGHTEATSGICSLVKIIIAIETGYIAPSIQLKSVKNDLVGIKKGRMGVVTELTGLERDDAVIGADNFGIGGSNVFVLLRRFKKVKVNGGVSQDDASRLVCVSGRTKKAVAVLLDSVSERPDDEYLGLLHQIFKQEISGHLYRGYTIVSKSGVVKAALKLSDKKRQILQIVVGHFQEGYKSLVQDIKDLPNFQAVFDNLCHGKNMKVAEHVQLQCLLAFITQVAFVQILKLLEIDLKIIYVDCVGKLIYDYFSADVKLEEALHDIVEISKQQRNQKICEEDLVRNINKKFPDSLIVNLSDYEFGSEVISFGADNSLTFLEMLGRLYQAGYNFRVDKLYPAVEFPVSRSTQMISPLIQWDYRKSWYNCKNYNPPESKLIQQKHSISCELYEEHSYLSGHIIDGRNFIPVGEYLHLVWKTLLKGYGLEESCTLPLVFENCVFTRTVELTKDKVVNLLVTIQKINGRFEVAENESTVVSGKVFFPEDINKHQLQLPSYDVYKKCTEFLDQREVYQKFSLRDHNYNGFFKNIKRYNVDGTAALVTWKNNWTVFIENLLQLKLLHLEIKSCCVISSIKNLSIDTKNHVDFTKNCGSLCPVQFHKKCNVIKSRGVEIRGIATKTIPKTNSSPVPILEKYTFVPNNTDTNLKESVRVVVQIVVENSLEDTFKAIEIINGCTKSNFKLLTPLCSEALNDISIVIPDLTISSKTALNISADIKVVDYVLTPISNFLLIIATGILKQPNLLNQYLNALKPNGFLLTREKINCIPEDTEYIQVITEHIVKDEKLILFRKTEKVKKVKVVEIVPNNFNWIPQLQTFLNEEDKVVVYSQNLEQGVLGIVNSLRKEPKEYEVSCFLTSEAPKFDVDDDFYSRQLSKNMVVNIFKNGTWGTYRYLPLEITQEDNNCNTRNNIKCVENIFDDNQKLNYIPDKSTGLKNNEILSLSRKNIKSHRKIMSKQTFPVEVIAGESLKWQFSYNWSWEEASIVLVAYLTAFYAFYKVIKPKRGMSVLINSVNDCFGLAIVNVCLHNGLDVYITISNEKRKHFLRKYFHQILDSHIGILSDMCFEKVIKSNTNRCGVDIVVNTYGSESLVAVARYIAAKGTFLQFETFSTNTDISDTSINSLLFEKNVNYHSITLDRVFFEAPDRNVWIVNKFSEEFNLDYKKPLPKIYFEPDELQQTCKYLTIQKHPEKFTIELIERKDKYDEPVSLGLGTTHSRFYCDSEKSYIVLGGLGGFGLEFVDWLCLRGARKILVASRTGIRTGYQNQKLRKLKTFGVSVQIYTGDITCRQGCLDLVNESKKLGAVDGIFNLALVLKDALFENQNKETFSSVLAPKANATFYLDKITRQFCPQLRHFVVFSSGTCGQGNAGQTNYGMANSIMEGICERRKSDGLPGLAIQWGPVGDVGSAARMEKENKTLIIGGNLLQKMSSCLEILEPLLMQDSPIVSTKVVAPKMINSKSVGITEAVASILGIRNIKTVTMHSSLAELGLDSIMSAEIVSVLKKDFDVRVSANSLTTMTFASLTHLENKNNVKTTG